ncbi:CG3303 [Drosophila busckii]|uniref:CG3303 n=1 Tax=Drosophila busckii TaxID=30019 RepID=A0A0M4F2Z5_DROBS|nr:CG3303 [Drosophila busckii]
MLSQVLFNEESRTIPYIFKVNFQGKTEFTAKNDRAPERLFEFHQDMLIKDSSSITALLLRLFNNYELDVSLGDIVTAEHKQEQNDFLRAVMNTRVMKLTMDFLVKRGLVPVDNGTQLTLLQDLWFTPYSRGKGIVGSSSFEYVFMAEIRNQNVLGLHNWIYFAEQEHQGHADYKGWISRVDSGKLNKFALAMRSTFYDLRSPYNSFLVGSSPELEMSLFTVCFLVMPEKQPCEIRLGRAKLSIVLHTRMWMGKRVIDTAYIELL